MEEQLKDLISGGTADEEVVPKRRGRPRKAREEKDEEYDFGDDGDDDKPSKKKKDTDVVPMTLTLGNPDIKCYLQIVHTKSTKDKKLVQALKAEMDERYGNKVHVSFSYTSVQSTVHTAVGFTRDAYVMLPRYS
jgi:hypothetical protein